jgi:hypothetical protein
MRIRGKGVMALMLASVAAALVACATVANLDVAPAPAPTREKPDDLDDPNAPPDAASDGAGDSGIPMDAADARPAPAPSVCTCPMEQGCCAKAGGNSCAPVPEAGSCIADQGLFLRCSGSDVANGRTCCFTKDSSGTFYGATCDDAGAQVCTDQTECEQGTCTPVTCRMVALKACVVGAPPACP